MSGAISASFGVASGGVGPDGLEPFIAVADSALYAAKSRGRNCVQAYRMAA